MGLPLIPVLSLHSLTGSTYYIFLAYMLFVAENNTVHAACQVSLWEKIADKEVFLMFVRMPFIPTCNIFDCRYGKLINADCLHVSHVWLRVCSPTQKHTHVGAV